MNNEFSPPSLGFKEVVGMKAFLSISAFFTAAVAGYVLSAIVYFFPRLRFRLPLALVLVLGFDFACWGMPYHGAMTEIIVWFIAVIALALPMSAIDESNQAKARAENVPHGCAMFALALMIVPALFPLTMRIARAVKMDWQCDGWVSRKFHSRNHAAPTLVVHDGPTAANITFEGVTPALWDRAKIGDRFRKEAEHSDGWLNGARVEVVPPFWGRHGPP